MPHKHKRKRGNDDSEFNLPPSQNARPLPVTLPKKNQGKPNEGSGTGKRKAKGREKSDDAPRAFKRLMAVAQGKKTRSGLDNGDGKPSAREPAPEALRIRPGEDLRSFAVRVDATLPVSGLTKKTIVKDGKDEVGFKVYRTRKERKMHKLYDQWRAEERKIQDQREEEAELAAEDDLENDAAGVTATMPDLEEGSGKKKGRRRRGQADEDPWAELKKKRAEAKVGLHDVAQAPPELNKKISHPLKIAGAAVDVANVPKAAGSLRRREELQGIRADVVEAYRKIREHEQSKLTGS